MDTQKGFKHIQKIEWTELSGVHGMVLWMKFKFFDYASGREPEDRYGWRREQLFSETTDMFRGSY